MFVSKDNSGVQNQRISRKFDKQTYAKKNYAHCCMLPKYGCECEFGIFHPRCELSSAGGFIINKISFSKVLKLIFTKKFEAKPT